MAVSGSGTVTRFDHDDTTIDWPVAEQQSPQGHPRLAHLGSSFLLPPPKSIALNGE